MDNQNLTNGTSNLGGNTNSPSGLKLEPTEPKRKVNVPAIIFGVTTLLCAGAAIFFGINYFSNNGGDGQGSMSDGVVQQNGDKVVASSIAGEYGEVKQVMKEVLSGEELVYIGGSSDLPYKPDGLNTFVPLKFNLKTEIRNSKKGEENVANIKSGLEKAGFSAVGDLPILGSAGPQDSGYFNTEKGVVCGVYADYDYYDSDDSSKSSEYAVLECGKTSWSWLTDEEKLLISELETAYHDKTGEYPSVIHGFDTEVKDSQIEPYQTLQVAIGGAVGLFYRVSPDAKWQFLDMTQAPLYCNQYDTDDAKKAFAGDVCYIDDTTESTVKP